MTQPQLFADAVDVRALCCGVTHDRELVQRLVTEWHSLLGAPQGWKVAYLLSSGNTIVGVATWGRPVARLEDQDTTLQLTRMALHDAPRNAATRFLALMRHDIRATRPGITRLISYQDADHHHGTMYKADNWTPEPLRASSHTWTNRADRIGNERKNLVKWKRVP